MVGEEGFDRTGAPAHDPVAAPPNGNAKYEKAPALLLRLSIGSVKRDSIGLALQPTTQVAAPPNGNAKYEKAPALLLRL
ncbi:hypothetical protein AMR76_14575 [Vibrio furnissii]|uniref:Uncharacterized protein n=1 Tax=Vibrio furnissii TaxID=29494 RepID=A0A0Q2QYT9_VIBFU|nr:hypothetical protein AMR76_14575 [Vibrio furnissii]